MSRRDGAQVLIRVERGHADEEELAALALVFLALGEGAEPDREQLAVGTSWWRQGHGYSAPDSWRCPAPLAIDATVHSRAKRTTPRLQFTNRAYGFMLR
ncbi:acyl-CoA carboxylase epsilon subunit [Streptomyces sp. NPDC052043]|uniref:acyl-CoA carboxylase epsilon subunit n=1 Tax=Streptomyces sp. NPDC052043 TaxID=3365684 RepID=UPI0037D8CFFB